MLSRITVVYDFGPRLCTGYVTWTNCVRLSHNSSLESLRCAPISWQRKSLTSSNHEFIDSVLRNRNSLRLNSLPDIPNFSNAAATDHLQSHTEGTRQGETTSIPSHPEVHDRLPHALKTPIATPVVFVMSFVRGRRRKFHELFPLAVAPSQD